MIMKMMSVMMVITMMMMMTMMIVLVVVVVVMSVDVYDKKHDLYYAVILGKGSTIRKVMGGGIFVLHEIFFCPHLHEFCLFVCLFVFAPPPTPHHFSNDQPPNLACCSPLLILSTP